MILKVPISKLPDIGFQRQYIDDFLSGKITHILNYKIVGAVYGHCNDYPRGFYLKLEVNPWELNKFFIDKLNFFK